MRVLHFCDGFSPLSETFIYDMLVELDRQAGDQHVVTFHRENAEHRPFSSVQELATPGRWHPGRLWRRALAELGAFPAWMAGWPTIRDRLYRAIRAARPDVLHAHFGPQGVLLAPVARLLGLPLVTSFYGYDASALLEDRRWRDMLSDQVREAHCTVSLSQAMRACLVGIGAPVDRVHIVHLGKHLSAYPYLPRLRVRRFLSVGRMTEKKGHHDTVMAFATVVKLYPDVHLDIVGGGDLFELLQAQVNACGLTKHVTLHGPKPHVQVRELFCRSDAFVLSSRRAATGDSEGTPTVLLEAQAMGLPCVSTLHAGIPEMIPDENRSLLVAEGDVQGIAARMIQLLESEAEELTKISELGRAHVAVNYNVELEAAKLLRIYSAAA